MKKYILALILLSITLLAALSGCSPKPITEQTPTPEILFTSTHNLENQLNYLINNSNTIHCAFYDLKLESTINLLQKKSAILITDKNRTEKGLMHNKFCIFDNKIVWTGSFNPTNNGLKNDNNVIIFFSEKIAQIYEVEFQELQNNQFAAGKQTKNNNINNISHYFCPEDNCKDIVIKELSKAGSSIYFMTFTFTHKDIADKLIKKSKQIEIKGITEKERINMEYEKYKYLKENKINVKPDISKHTLHHKVFIIDNTTTITGSFNPTISADTRNDENLIIIRNKNITRLYLQEFSRIWDKS